MAYAGAAQQSASHRASSRGGRCSVKPVLQVMQPREIFAGAMPAAVPVELDEMEHRLRRPALARLIEHAGEGERGLEEGPAIRARPGSPAGPRPGTVDLQREGAIGVPTRARPTMQVRSPMGRAFQFSASARFARARHKRSRPRKDGIQMATRQTPAPKAAQGPAGGGAGESSRIGQCPCKRRRQMFS